MPPDPAPAARCTFTASESSEYKRALSEFSELREHEKELPQ